MISIEQIGKLNTLDLVLASKSPRRQHLFREMGLNFRIAEPIIESDEIYPAVLKGADIPVYLARAKSILYNAYISGNSVLITADTVVWLDEEIIGKPGNDEEAVIMLKKLSGRVHQVFTGVCIRSISREITFSCSTDVHFKPLSDDEIFYYVKKFHPVDKAGAYGIQEWIGYVGVDRIEGSYFNVMGLPVHRLYSELINFI